MWSSLLVHTRTRTPDEDAFDLQWGYQNLCDHVHRDLLVHHKPHRMYRGSLTVE